MIWRSELSRWRKSLWTIQIDLTDKLYNYRAANEKRAQKHYLKTLQTKII